MSAKTLAITLTAAALLSAGAANACPNCKSHFKPGTYTGQARVLGNGTAYTWVTLDAKGKPSSVGVTLTETALEGLPAAPPTGAVGTEHVLEMPREAEKTPFTHIVLNWNPLGHPPAGIYDRPHFDFHFYTISPMERMGITAKGADLARCQKPLPAGQMAPGYVYAPGAEEAMMGGHWIDPTSPELHGQPFTNTFIYGSYSGRLAFIEPMLTRAYLQAHPDQVVPIKVPAVYARSAYYPTRYHVHYDATRHEVVVALEGLTWRWAPGAQSITRKPAPARREARR